MLLIDGYRITNIGGGRVVQEGRKTKHTGSYVRVYKGDDLVGEVCISTRAPLQYIRARPLSKHTMLLTRQLRESNVPERTIKKIVGGH